MFNSSHTQLCSSSELGGGMANVVGLLYLIFVLRKKNPLPHILVIYLY